jgi:hypothetical protein
VCIYYTINICVQATSDLPKKSSLKKRQLQRIHLKAFNALLNECKWLLKDFRIFSKAAKNSSLFEDLRIFFQKRIKYMVKGMIFMNFLIFEFVKM